jgi:hypothetical protein
MIHGEQARRLNTIMTGIKRMSSAKLQGAQIPTFSATERGCMKMAISVKFCLDSPRIGR